MRWKQALSETIHSLRRVLCLPAGVFCLALAAAQADAATVTGGGVTGNAGATRFTAILSEPASYTVYVLPNPYRVVIDAPNLSFSLPPDAGSKGKGMVTSFRYGQVDAGKARIVMDVKGPVLITKSYLQPTGQGTSTQLIVDLAPTSEQAFEATLQRDAAATASAVASAGTPEAATQTAEPDDTAAAPLALPQPTAAPPEPQTDRPVPQKQRRLIVIDPGHGGVDPGAIGITGKREKDVTLAFGLALRDVLQASGQYDVLMTRADDRFISLENRARYAHEKAADLFIAIHADTVRAHDAHGATIYTLSDKASDAEAEALAQKENRADLIAGMDLGDQSPQVTDILISLAQRESKKHSVVFARKAVAEMKAVTNFTGKPMRSAGFVVLKAPDVPSVLVELGYLSSKPDEAQLGDDGWRNKVAAAMGRAVDKYFIGATTAATQ